MAQLVVVYDVDVDVARTDPQWLAEYMLDSYEKEIEYVPGPHPRPHIVSAEWQKT